MSLNFKKMIGVAAVSAIAVGTVASNTALAEDKIRWKVPTAFGTGLPALGDQIVRVADDLKAMSNGQIQLKVFEPGALVPGSGITEAVKDNKLAVGYTWLGYDQGRIPASVLIAAARPFGYEPSEYIAWWYEGGGKQLGEELYAEHNIHPILCGLSGPETAGWFRKEIKTVDDFKGLKIRFAGFGGKVLQELGASVTVIPGGEIFPALEKGALDASEFATPAADVKLGFYKVAKYNYFPGWHQPFTAFHFVVNTSVWEGMSDSHKAIVDNACTAGVVKNLARGEALSGPQMEKNKTNGVEVRILPDEVLSVLRSTALDVEKEAAAADTGFKKILDSQLAFDKSYKQWSTVGYLPR